MIILGIIASLFGCNTSKGNHVAEGDTIVSFSYSKSGGMRPYDGFGYSIRETKDGRVHFLFDEDLPDEKQFTIDDHSVFDQLQKIILKHKMYNYSGDYQPNVRVFDGHSWNLRVKYASGETISASGYMAGPQGYGEAFDEIRACLDEWKKMPGDLQEVNSFKYIYGKEQYEVLRMEDHTQVTYDNGATGMHEVYEKPLEMLEDLRVLMVVNRLRENYSYSTEGENVVPWSFEIHYGNGDHYLYQSCDSGFKCGYTYSIQDFFSHWMEEHQDKQ